MVSNRVVVIGASAGGVSALVEIVRRLPADFPAPICIVQHIGAHRSFLPKILKGRGRLSAQHAVDGQELVGGQIYVAPSDQHMQIEGSTIVLNRGPKEHHTRPAIDPLFRSAALSFGSRAIGVVLTGYLDDGTPGLQAIKEYGGIAVVQDPEEAEVSEMPSSALKHVSVDHCVQLDSMAGLLTTLVHSAPPIMNSVASQRTLREEAVFHSEGDVMTQLRSFATPSTYSCPDCKGTLWQQTDVRPTRYRCHTGHAFTLKTLQHAQSDATDEALWTAIRSLQEKAELHKAGAIDSREEGDESSAARNDAKVQQLEIQIAALRACTSSVDESDV